MAQVQDSTKPGSPSPDTAIPVRVLPEIDDESVLSEGTIATMSLQMAIPVTVLPKIHHESVIAIPVGVLPEIDDESVLSEETIQGLRRPKRMAMPVTFDDEILRRVSPSLPQPPRPRKPGTAPPENITESVIGDESKKVGSAPVTLPPESTLCRRGVKGSAPVTLTISGSAPVTLPPVTLPIVGSTHVPLPPEKGIDIDYETYEKYEKLRRAAVDDDWHFVKKFIENDPKALTAKLSDTGQTILHYMVNSKNIIEFVLDPVVEQMKPRDLEYADKNGLTVLSACAIVGNIEAAKIIVGKNRKLLNIQDNDGNLPLHYAAQFGHKDMVQFLLPKEEDRGPQKKVLDPSLRGESGVKLVENLITSNIYDIALEQLEGHKNLAREKLKHRKRVLEALAQKPLGFESGSQLEFWKRLIYKCIPDSALPHTRKGDEEEPDSTNPHTRRGDEEEPNSCLPHSRKNHGEDHKNTSKYCFTKCTQFSGAMRKKLYLMLYYIIKLVPGIQSIHDTKLKHKQTCELVKLICEGRTWNSKEASDCLKSPMLIAARLGIQEIVDEIRKVHPPSVAFLDEDGHNVFQLAVLHRQGKVFSLIYKMGVAIDWAANFRAKKDNNNILHLAGKLVPSIQVSGAALQMQRELQWYKVVENLFHSSLQEQKNFKGLTPREMFTEEHTDLVKEGQEWIKHAATSCSVVAALIITVTFSAAITVPGGNDNQGKPNYLNEKSFSIFAISNAVALFFSTNSVLMFLGILTSRYSEKDFLKSLPRKIMIGLVTLFISIGAMMIAFVATLQLLVFDPMRFWVVLLACLPVAIFVLLQFSLLIEMFGSTYCPRFIQQPKDSFAAKRKRRIGKIFEWFRSTYGPSFIQQPKKNPAARASLE